MPEDLNGNKIIVFDDHDLDRRLLELAVRRSGGLPITLKSIYFLQTVAGANGLLLSTTSVDGRDVNMALYYLTNHPIPAVVTTGCMHSSDDEKIVTANPHVIFLEGMPYKWEDRAIRALAQALNQQCVE